MPGQREDLVGLFDHVWDRFWRRMDGLDDEEWRWAPTADPRISLRWRLGHIRGVLSEERNGQRTERGLADDDEWRAVLADRFGIVL